MTARIWSDTSGYFTKRGSIIVSIFAFSDKLTVEHMRKHKEQMLR